MDIIIESLSTTGHIFRTKLPRQTSDVQLLRVRGSLERRMHRNIKTMDTDGFVLPVAA